MFKVVVIGTSYGGLEALKAIIPNLPEDYPLAILVVLHIGDNNNNAIPLYIIKFERGTIIILVNKK